MEFITHAAFQMLSQSLTCTAFSSKLDFYGYVLISSSIPVFTFTFTFMPVSSSLIIIMFLQLKKKNCHLFIYQHCLLLFPVQSHNVRLDSLAESGDRPSAYLNLHSTLLITTYNPDSKKGAKLWEMQIKQ